MVAPSNIIAGSIVWVEDPEVAWIDGEVKEIKGEKITVKCTSGKLVVRKTSNVYPKDPEFPPSGVDDMTKLAYLHEPGVLQNLRCRFDINEIYTYTGGILIAINPFQRLPHLYENRVMEKYKGANVGELSPHPFAIADSAYRQMIKEQISQAILVSGESGAGKTESTKMLMQYLAFMGGRNNNTGERSVEQKVLESNPVLEAFGNAKTVRNNNSSRFGKFVEIQFDGRGRISGAAIRTYLLERSRVCQVSDPERNYHCFYMLCAAPPEDVEKFKVGNPRTFHYLNQSNCFELDVLDDSKEYLETKRAMDIVGINQAEQEAIFRVVAAILHLGNVEFVKGKKTDGAEPKDDKSRLHLKTAADLFMCDEKSLEDSLCKRVIVTRGDRITKSLDPATAAISRDALAKIVYSKLFDWLVQKINISIGQDLESKFLIGVLDIYGFESFKTNSFEQFCINLTNEKLQQHFNQHVFKMEQEEYKKEQIDWSYIEFVDNQDILDLVEKKPGGIIALLDEACMFPRSTHETFAEKLYQTFKDHKRFVKPKLSRTDFTICHYAGDVTYQTELFLEKNKDLVVPEHQALLNASKCSFVSSLFPPLPEETSKSSKFSSIATGFKQQLQSLLETLNATEPHYGVMEAIRISTAGFPSRKMFREFINRFSILAPEVLNGSYNDVAASKRILEKSNLSGYQVGKTKVFLRAGQMAELDARRGAVLGVSAIVIQRKVRAYLSRRHFILLRLSSIKLQAFCRGQAVRHQYARMRRAAACLNIQKHSRKFLARKAYKNLYFSSVTIQAGIRGMIARDKLLLRKQMRAVTVIQSQCRRFLASRHYLRLKKAAITTQCAWRGKLARRELRNIRMAAKETGALLEANTKLEKQVEELTWELKKMQREKELLMKESGGTKNIAGKVPIIKEVPVIDNEFMVKLTAENEQLKALVTSLEKQIEETNKLSEERLKQASEAEMKIIELKTAMQRLEEKISDMETEDKILRQKALQSAPSRKMSPQSSFASSTPLQNGNHAQLNSGPSKRFGREDSRMRRSKIELPQAQEGVDSLIKCTTQNLGFSQEKPVAAFTIYKCLVHWRTLEAERTSVFDNLIQMIGSSLEKQDDNDHMAYWLSNTSALLFLLQSSLKSSAAAQKPPAPTSFFSRMTQSFRSSSANLAVGVVRQVEAKYPALLFKQQLTAYAEKIYGIIRDNLKKDLSLLLSCCIQVPRASKGTAFKTFEESEEVDSSPACHWQRIIESLNKHLSTLKENFVPPTLIQKIFIQIFAYINTQLFNSFLVRRECCTFSNGQYVKYGLAELELWCAQVTEEYAGSSWGELKHTRQAVAFLVLQEKSSITYNEITNELCPVLSVQQLYRICALFRDDSNNAPSVSSDVISSMKHLLSDGSADDGGSTFLLEDDISFPFSVEDIIGSMRVKEFAEVKPTAELTENPAFQFLLQD
ncbi:hypothetical protein ES332_A09G069800v1 [Gossypium tomentosum]|uniref:Myosin motor domain-containing protein n=1 Tax=Gossypium tomentosum TaxID=34277 RepID=A0A5D2NZE4_GOSTO|nr:hypothetical protein ES332_A09G069800v1 [Gossypium tomentosum]